jgi:hypothetical protein
MSSEAQIRTHQSTHRVPPWCVRWCVAPGAWCVSGALENASSPRCYQARGAWCVHGASNSHQRTNISLPFRGDDGAWAVRRGEDQGSISSYWPNGELAERASRARRSCAVNSLTLAAISGERRAHRITLRHTMIGAQLLNNTHVEHKSVLPWLSSAMAERSPPCHSAGRAQAQGRLASALGTYPHQPAKDREPLGGCPSVRRTSIATLGTHSHRHASATANAAHRLWLNLGVSNHGFPD